MIRARLGAAAFLHYDWYMTLRHVCCSGVPHMQRMLTNQCVVYLVNNVVSVSNELGLVHLTYGLDITMYVLK